jgi:protein required for attachment to host cells
VLTREDLHSLASAEPGTLLISVFARTDPRDPANTSATPAWQIALRDGLSTLAEQLEDSGSREERLAFRPLRERIEKELLELEPSERARSVAMFFDIAGGDARRFSLQLPLRRDAVVGDSRPFVSPLVDIADRGSPTGVILATGDMVRLLQIEQSEASEPENSTFELELGDWRKFGGTAGGSPARGRQVISQRERYEARVDAQRHHLFEAAVTATAGRLHQFGWERIVLVCEREIATQFRQTLPAELSERVIAEADLNLLSEEPAAIADALEPLIEQAWSERTQSLVELARDRAKSGGAAALGAQETFAALAEGRVEHLLLDPEHDFSPVAGMIRPAIDCPPEMIAERGVEQAVATGAQVTAVADGDSPALADAGGIAALLRY